MTSTLNPLVERRESPRQRVNGVMARICDKLVEVVDLSETGIKVARSFEPAEGRLSFTLFRRTGSSLEINSSVKVTGHVVRVDDEMVAINFIGNSYALAKLVVWNAADRLGTVPHMVK